VRSHQRLTNILSEVDMLELEELTALLHANEQITPNVVDALDYHAAALSKNICDDFTRLNAIVVRHEALVISRWQNKTVAKRRDILLGAWPNMPKHHRPDSIRGNRYREEGSDEGTIPECDVWPFSTS
jgi:hypothetical protein